MNAALSLRPISVVASASGSREQRLSDVIGLIYDAAIDPGLWPKAMQQAADIVGGRAAALLSKDVGADHASGAHHVGLETPPPANLFQLDFQPLDRHFQGDLEQPIATTDLLPGGDLYRTELYRQWGKPQGFVDFVSAVIDRTAVSAAIFGVFRHERDGIVDERARRQLSLLAPHVRRAVLIGKMFDFKDAEVATFVDAFDGLTTSMFLVGADGRLIHSNAAGAALLAERDILTTVASRLAACDPRTTGTLREAFAASERGDEALGARGIAVPMTSKRDERYIAHVLPLTSGARSRAGIVYTAVAALFVRKAELAASATSQVIGEAFKLTPTELRVLMAIIDVGGIPEVATAFGVADTTVRTHVNRLFEKTGATRQADLVKLVAGYATSIAG